MPDQLFPDDFNNEPDDGGVAHVPPERQNSGGQGRAGAPSGGDTRPHRPNPQNQQGQQQNRRPGPNSPNAQRPGAAQNQSNRQGRPVNQGQSQRPAGQALPRWPANQDRSARTPVSDDIGRLPSQPRHRPVPDAQSGGAEHAERRTPSAAAEGQRHSAQRPNARQHDLPSSDTQERPRVPQRRPDSGSAPVTIRRGNTEALGPVEAKKAHGIKNAPTPSELPDEAGRWALDEPKPPKLERLKAAQRGKSSPTIFSGILKMVIYIVAVFAVSIFLGVNIINIGNDVFALVKPDTVVNVQIPENADIKTVAQILAKAGVIKYPSIFELYAQFRKKTDDILPGPQTVSASQNYDELLAQIRDTNARQIVQITFTEGMTVDDVISLFLKNGIGTQEGFVSAINDDSYPYDFVTQLTASGPLPDGRKYRLEGYLFPDTYQFYTDSTEHTCIDKLLYNFNQKFVQAYYTRAQVLGLTVDQVVTLASMVQAEAKYPDDLPIVSSVFHNRLDSPAAFPTLDSDATVMYGLQARVQQLTSADLQNDTPYNTYLHPGLPPSAICNPGLDAIVAALFPTDPNPGYYYFVSMPDGTMLYAGTLAEQTANINTMHAAQAAVAATATTAAGG